MESSLLCLWGSLRGQNLSLISISVDLNGIELVRRPTGGKAVLHHHELTYSVVSNDPSFFPIADISRTYCRIADAIQRGLRTLGIETTLAGSRGRSTGTGPLATACFALSNHFELLCQNRKLVGSAQRRTKTAFLQHGSILLEFDPRTALARTAVVQRCLDA